jgi:hypothetical protein
VRDAIAHIIPDDKTKVPLDPDLPGHREQLHEDARLMKDLARLAIMKEWPKAVEWEYRHADSPA